MEQLLACFNSIHSMSDTLVEYLKKAVVARTLRREDLLLSGESVNCGLCFIKKGVIWKNNI